MKRRKTVERWLADIWPTGQNKRKADERDRQIDRSVGAQKKQAVDKTPETDWRRLLKQSN